MDFSVPHFISQDRWPHVTTFEIPHYFLFREIKESINKNALHNLNGFMEIINLAPA